MNCSIQTSHPPLASGMKAMQVWFGSTQDPAGLGAGTSNLDFTFTKNTSATPSFSETSPLVPHIYVLHIWSSYRWMGGWKWVGWVGGGKMQLLFSLSPMPPLPPSAATQTHKPTHCKGPCLKFHKSSGHKHIHVLGWSNGVSGLVRFGTMYQ